MGSGGSPPLVTEHPREIPEGLHLPPTSPGTTALQGGAGGPFLSNPNAQRPGCLNLAWEGLGSCVYVNSRPAVTLHISGHAQVS